ncbi:MAG: hypothetical protein R3B90_14900 [Planctomycetaceae bacterium]
MSVDTSGISDKREDGSDLDLSYVGHRLGVKLHAAGIEAEVPDAAVAEQIAGEAPLSPQRLDELVIALHGRASGGYYDGDLPGYHFSGIEVTGELIFRGGSGAVQSQSFEVTIPPPTFVYSRYDTPERAPFDGLLSAPAFLGSLNTILTSRVGGERAYEALLETGEFSDAHNLWQALDQLQTDAAGRLRRQLNAPCFESRRRAAALAGVATSGDGSSLLSLDRAEWDAIDFYNRPADYWNPEHLSLDNLLDPLIEPAIVALESAEVPETRMIAARILAEANAKEAIASLRGVLATPECLPGSRLESEINAALFKLDPPAYARPATYILLLIALVPIGLGVIMFRRR